MGQDRAAEWDNQKTADDLFGSGGGMAVWVRNDEHAPRACVRKGGDLAESAINVGLLIVGVDKLVASIAELHGVTADQVRSMAELAIKEYAPHLEHVARVMPKNRGE